MAAMSQTPFIAQATAARTAARELATLPRGRKDAALHAMADALASAAGDVLAANAVDVETARAEGTSQAMIDRLCLDTPRSTAWSRGCVTWPV